MEEQRLEAIRKLGEMLTENFLARRRKPMDAIVEPAIISLVESVYKSADSGKSRSDFAKGREQMAMHAIGLLVGSDWKAIERILFGENDGTRQESD